MAIDRTRLRGAYARLKGMQQAVMSSDICSGTLGHDLNGVAKELAQLLGEPMGSFELPHYAFFGGGGGDRGFCKKDEVENKLNQLVSYLEYTQHVGEEIIQIGSIYNSIQDEHLKARCADLLSAPGNFDRVINQATLVLEDRIRSKSGSTTGAVGVALVSEVVKGERLKFSAEKHEQDGYASILRGVVAAYRNPTHHHLLDHITREEALKVCAFIDCLLKIVDGADVAKSS
jgi:uncharacterized protein (TIGR02391 family)